MFNVGSQLNHYFYSLQPLLNTLAKHPLAPQSLQQFIFAFSQRFDTYQQAMKAHIEVWQTIYRDCALTWTNKGVKTNSTVLY